MDFSPLKRSNMIIKFINGYRVSGVDAPTAKKELDRIRRERGKLTPAVIVDEARSKSNPLHSVFEWDNSVAAQKFRENQAGTLTRSIVIKEAEIERREYVLTIKDDERQYMPIDLVLEDTEMWEYSLRRLQSQLNGMQKSVNELTDAKRMPSATKRKMKQLAKHITKAANVAASV